MKNIALLMAAIFVSIVTVCQQVKWDSTYRPGNYEQKVANFRNYPNSKKDIIFLGNSITDYAEWNELLQLPEVRNRCICFEPLQAASIIISARKEEKKYFISFLNRVEE